jgi:hypothetical protein
MMHHPRNAAITISGDISKTRMEIGIYRTHIKEWNFNAFPIGEFGIKASFPRVKMVISIEITIGISNAKVVRGLLK